MDEKEEENLQKTLIELAVQLARMGVEAGLGYLRSRLKGKTDSPEPDTEDIPSG